jgi:hypothetical protein
VLAGPALLEVAQQYAAISKELEDKEWALHKVCRESSLRPHALVT